MRKRKIHAIAFRWCKSSVCAGSDDKIKATHYMEEKKQKENNTNRTHMNGLEKLKVANAVAVQCTLKCYMQ